MTQQRFTPALRPLVAALVFGYAGASIGQAMPHNPTVINGTAVVNSFSNGMQVVNSPGAIIHWDSFSIGNGRTVRFDQIGSQSAVLNRVTGGSYSEILGTLQSNGRVFMLNPNGIVFGPGSRVDVAGLLASTLNISDADFLAGNYRFACFNATVCDSGVDVLNPYTNRIVLKDGSQITTRTAGEGGQVWLIAKDSIISDRGSRIDAPTGQVLAATAREVTVTSPSLGQMSFTLTGTTGSGIDLAGDIDVPRGAAGFFADTIRLAGIVSARSDVGAAGQIVARAAGDLLVDGDARLDVSGNAGADAGAVRLRATKKITVHPNSETAADGGAPTAAQAAPKGGLIELEAYQVSLPWVASGQSLYDDRPGPSAALHAYAAGAAHLDVSRHGTVRIAETGSFEIVRTVVDLPISAAAGTPAMLVQVDGRALSISNDIDGLWAYVNLANGQLAGPRQSVMPPVAPGQSLSLAEERLFTLSGGGWLYAVAFQVFGPPPSPGEGPPPIGGLRGMVHVVGADGQLLQSILLNEVLPGFVQGVWATRGGGFVAPDGATADAVRHYTGAGVIDTQANAASAGARPAMHQILPTNGPYGLLPDFYLTYDLRRTLAEGPPQVLSNPVDGDVLWTSSGNARFQGGMAPGLWFADPMLPNGHGIGGRTDVYSTAGKLIYEGIARNGYHGDTQTDYYDTRNVLGSDRVMVRHNKAVNGATLGDTVYVQSVAFYDRNPVAMPFAAQNAEGRVAASPLLASRPGGSNGVAGEAPFVPPVMEPPQSPAAGGPAATGELPPPAYFVPTRAAGGFEAAASPMRIPAELVNGGRSQAEIDAEILKDAGNFVREYMGEPAAKKFEALTNPEDRAPFMNEVVYAMAVGKDLYEATRDMGQDMRGALFSGWAGVQMWGLEEEKGFSDGLHRALTEKKKATPNEDGSPGTDRTRLQIPLDVLELELKQAKTDEEKARIGRRVLRELVLGARAEAGQQVDDTADLELPDGKGGTVRITDDGEMIASGA